MKVGDTYPVTLAGHEVTRAVVTSMEDGIANLRFEGKHVKMSYVTQLAPEAPAPVEQPTTQHIVDEVVRTQSGESAPVGGEAVEENTPEQVTPVQSADVSTTVAVEQPQEAAVAQEQPQENTPAPADG